MHHASRCLRAIRKMLVSERSIGLKLSWFILFGIFTGADFRNPSTTVKPSDTSADRKTLGLNNVIKCKGDGICTCPTDPLTSRYPDSTDPSCERYYLCHLGFAFQKKCPVREAFHPEKKECISRSQVPFQVCPPPIPCKTNGFEADPKDCTKYYTCFYRQAYHYACQYEHYYDREEEKCILNKTRTDNCKDKIQITISPSTTSERTTLVSNELDEISMPR